MIRINRNVFCSVAIFVLFAAFTQAKGQRVSGSLEKRTVTPGSTLRGKITLDIPEGFHVNSHRPNSEYAIPTSVKLRAEGLTIGKIVYPRGKNRKFQFSESELNVYEGRIAVPFEVRVPVSFRRKRVTLVATVRYQACTEEVCYAPRNKTVVMTATVR